MTGKAFPPLSRDMAAHAVAIVEAAIAAGAAWPPVPGSVTMSAIGLAAKAAGLSRVTLRGRLMRAHELYGLAPKGVPLPPVQPKAARRKAEPEAPAPKLPEHERQIIRQRDEIADLRKRLEAAHRENMEGAALAEILAGLVAEPVTAPEWLAPPKPAGKASSPHVPVAPWSDWHVGEVVDPDAVRGVNSYSTEVFRRRVKRLLDRTTMLCRHYGPGNYPSIVIPLVGDLVSGGLHPELAKTDDQTLLQSILLVRDVLVEALVQMADEFGAVYAPAVAGNHGRTTPKPEFKGYNYKNADWLIYQLVARALADRGEKRVTIDIPPSNEAYFRIFGLRVLQVHGDMLGVKGGDGIIGSIGPIMRGKVKVGARMRSFGEDFDLLLMGHWHQELFLPGVIVSNSLKGYDEYVMKGLSAPFSLPSQPLFFVHPKIGITSYSTILLEDPPAREGAGWVSLPEARVA